MTDKKLKLTEHQLEAVALLARRRGMSRSAVIGDVITRYASGQLGFTPAQAEQFTVEIAFAPPESYAQAMERAHQARITLADVIRQVIIHEAQLGD